MKSSDSKNRSGSSYSRLICPDCHSELIQERASLHCSGCGVYYPIRDNIADFRKKDTYWCNVGREKMKELNISSRKSGDWLKCAQQIVPEYLPHLTPFYRADSQFLWPTSSRSRILDAGCMWGGISIPTAQFHHEVYAVDMTLETLDFLAIRASQMGLDNIFPVASSVSSLPFPENYFDLVVLNGVLEWVAVDEEIVLEKQWKKNWTGLQLNPKTKYTENPEQMQVKVLKELNRVLKPNGSLFLAIENRFGYIYLAGWPDDHMNLPFVCFMPRSIANIITRLFLGCEYRTYVYSVPGYRSLLEKAGFSSTELYGAFQHYINPTHIVPYDLIESSKREIFMNTRRYPRMILKMVPAKILKFLSPSIMAISRKNVSTFSHHESRIKQLFSEASIINNGCHEFKIMKCKSRLENECSANFMVYTDSRAVPTYYCKICRNALNPGMLQDEARNLKKVRSMIKTPQIAGAVPELIFQGTVDGITFLVTKYQQTQRSRFDFNYHLNKRNMKNLDHDIEKALDFLLNFQKDTTREKVDARTYLGKKIRDEKYLLVQDGLDKVRTHNGLRKLVADIDLLESEMIPLCSIHGDFDFFHNIMFGSAGIKVFDFEHFREKGLPFYDLITLLFHPILLSYEHQHKGLTIPSMLKDRDLLRYLRKWLFNYSKRSGISLEVMRLSAAIATFEQRTMIFPDYRDPETYPFYERRAFNDMLDLRIDKKSRPFT